MTRPGLSAQMTAGKDLGDRFEVRRWGVEWGVFDLAEMRGEPLSRHRDEIDAVADCARRNHARRQR